MDSFLIYRHQVRLDVCENYAGGYSKTVQVHNWT